MEKIESFVPSITLTDVEDAVIRVFADVFDLKMTHASSKVPI